MSNYPLLIAALSTKSDYWNVKRLERLNRAIAESAAFLATGAIPNMTYKENRSYVAGAIHDAFGETIGKYTYAGLWEKLPRDVYEFECDNNLSFIDMHNVPCKMKKVKACKLSHPLIDDVLALLVEVDPLNTMFETLKGMAVKRQPKPVEDRVEKYNAPSISGTATAKVRDLLIQITEEEKIALEEQFALRYQHYVHNYMAAQAEMISNGKHLSPHDFFCPRNRYPNHHACDIVDAVVTSKNYRFEAFALRPDHKAILRALADKHAEQIRKDFVYKNLSKIASIVEAKGNFKLGEIIGREVNMSGLKGTLRFSFEDGSSFVVRNTVESAVSTRGLRFNRWPLRFENVIMQDGSKMGRPSEQRMNEVFINL